MSILFEYVNGINTSEVCDNMYLLDEYFTQIDNKDGIEEYERDNKGQIYLKFTNVKEKKYIML